jgi:hypothetical protein
MGSDFIQRKVNVMERTAPTKKRPRSIASGVLLTLAVLLTPTALITNWATVQVDSTQRFVDTLGPLASNPKIQDLVINEVTNKLDETVDFSGTTSSLIDGLSSALNLPAPAQKALGLISDPLAAGVKGLVHDAVSKVVKSDGFQAAWTQTLTITQEQVTKLLKGEESGVLKMAADGTVTMNLKPVIAQVKQSLINSGVGFAAAIPEMDLTVELGKIPELAVARVVYQIGVGIGTWLPWVVFGLFLLGFAFAVRRARAVVVTSVFLLISSVLMLITFSFGRLLAINSVSDTFAPAVGVVWDAVSDYAVTVVAGLIALSVISLVAAWIFTGDERSPIRQWFGRTFDWLRGRLDGMGLTMGRAGEQLYRARVPLRVIIIVVAGFIVAMVQPMNVGSVIWASVIVLLLFFVLELLQRPPVVAPKRAATAQPTAKGTGSAKSAGPTKRPASARK